MIEAYIFRALTASVFRMIYIIKSVSVVEVFNSN